MEDKLNLLMINYEFPPIGGGGANANRYLLKEFSKNKKLKIDLVTSSETANYYTEIFSDNITIHRLNVGKKRLHYWTEMEIVRFLYRSSGYVNSLIKEKRYHLSHSFFAFPSGYISYRHRKEVPYIVSLRGSDVPGFNKRFSLQYLFLAPLFKRIWNGAEAVIANSRELKALALNTAPELSVGVIYNGIDTDEFAPLDRSNRSGLTVLCVARLIQRKGIDHLIRAFPAVVKAAPNARLVIAGEGNMEAELKGLASELGIADRIVFRGYVRHDDLPELYRDADVFVLPSLWEGMSNTLLEAISAGLPVVVTDTGGTAELIRDNGMVVPKEDSEAISEAVIRLLGDNGLRDGMGSRSREIALEFSWQKVAEQYMVYYEKCARKVL